jgi:hypothetical protein
MKKGNKILIDFSIPKGLRKLREKSDFAPFFHNFVEKSDFAPLFHNFVEKSDFARYGSRREAPLPLLRAAAPSGRGTPLSSTRVPKGSPRKPPTHYFVKILILLRLNPFPKVEWIFKYIFDSRDPPYD